MAAVLAPGFLDPFAGRPRPRFAGFAPFSSAAAALDGEAATFSSFFGDSAGLLSPACRMKQ